MKHAGLIAGAAIAAALGGCAATSPTSVGADGAAPVDLVEAPATDDRPTDWKKLQSWLALRGLSFTRDAVTVDAASAREVEHASGSLASSDAVARSAELLAINARVRAMGAARDAVLADPGNARAYQALGAGLRSKRKDEFALAAFSTAAVLDPSSAPIRADLADAYNRVGERERARAAYREAVRLDPSDAGSYQRLAILDYYLGDDASAWRNTREAERLGGGVPPQFFALLSDRTPEP